MRFAERWMLETVKRSVHANGVGCTGGCIAIETQWNRTICLAQNAADDVGRIGRVVGSRQFESAV